MTKSGQFPHLMGNIKLPSVTDTLLLILDGPHIWCLPILSTVTMGAMAKFLKLALLKLKNFFRVLELNDKMKPLYTQSFYSKRIYARQLTCSVNIDIYSVNFETLYCSSSELHNWSRRKTCLYSRQKNKKNIWSLKSHLVIEPCLIQRNHCERLWNQLFTVFLPDYKSQVMKLVFFYISFIY